MLWKIVRREDESDNTPPTDEEKEFVKAEGENVKDRLSRIDYTLDDQYQIAAKLSKRTSRHRTM